MNTLLKERLQRLAPATGKFETKVSGLTVIRFADMCLSIFERFGTDYIDFYWIHNPHDVEKWTPHLIPLLQSGKVRRIGISNHNLEQIKQVESILAAGANACPPFRTTTACCTVLPRTQASWPTARKKT